jgi:hypothetical protein
MDGRTHARTHARTSWILTRWSPPGGMSFSSCASTGWGRFGLGECRRLGLALLLRLLGLAPTSNSGARSGDDAGICCCCGADTRGPPPLPRVGDRAVRCRRRGVVVRGKGLKPRSHESWRAPAQMRCNPFCPPGPSSSYPCYLVPAAQARRACSRLCCCCSSPLPFLPS